MALLLRRPGVVSAKANALTGSVLVIFELPATVTALAKAIANADPDSAANTSERLEAAASGAAQASSSKRSSRAVDAPRVVPPADDAPPWHAMPVADALRQLATDARCGLDAIEVENRRVRHGTNELRRTEPRSTLSIFAEQLTSLPIVLLGASAVISLLTGGIADAVVILGVVVANASIAAATERQAERTILGLSDYSPHPVRVRRAGGVQEVLPVELVPGDVIVLELGTLVAADARLVEDDELTVNESPLTGEALPAQKNSNAQVRSQAALADRATMVFRGTAVTGGCALAVVVATGANTEIGRIQHLLGTVRPPETPIQRQLGDIERELVVVNGAICATVFALGMLRGEGWLPMLRTAISLAVAAIPEGLPAVATTTLAVGVQDMRRRNVLVRTLDAVETLGAVEVVGLDKTGTLTDNRMAVAATHVDGELHEVVDGELATDGMVADAPARALVARLLEVACLASDAALVQDERGQAIVGTPTESALVQTAVDFGVDVAALRVQAPVIRTIARASGRKRMSTLHRLNDSGTLLCVKGDPVEVLSRCRSRSTTSGAVDLDEGSRMSIQRANQRMAGRALRVLGVAVGDGGGDPRNEQALTWLGLVGLANPIREGARSSIGLLHRAGVRTVMITGDQSATAYAIAKELDLGQGDEIRVLESGQITGIDSNLLAAISANPHVFARVSPADKLAVVRALQANGRIVAMTGDGINDGPALKAADIGIAMGGGGTDVAREVADIVLATDDLGGLIEALRLGRATYANIRKVLRFLIGTNAAETMVMLASAIAGLPEPLHPMQLLWLNLVTDVLPGLALGLEPAEPDVLEGPPHDPRAPILSVGDFRRLLLEGGVLGVATMVAFLTRGGAGGARHAGPAPRPTAASTVAFHGLSLAQLAHAIACRSETHGVIEEFRRPPNPKLLAALAACTAMQIGAQALPFARRLIGLAPLRAPDLAAIGAVVVGSVTANEAIGSLLRAGRARRAGMHPGKES